MSRFTVSILLATALLGILLWVVVSMAVEFARAPETPLPPPEEPVQLDPALPRINNRSELITWLAVKTADAPALVRAGEHWLEERGYPPGYRLLTPGTPENELIAQADDAELLILAGNGDLDAMHELAERSLRDRQDPLEALAWYDRAIVNGSLYAMLRTADLITTLTDPALSGFVSEPAWTAAVDELNSQGPAPAERALGWALAAVTMGGYALLDAANAGRIATLSQSLDAAGRDRACEIAQDYVLDAAASRRAKGNAVFAIELPAFAISIDAPAAALPCSVPVPPLVPLDECKAIPFVGNGPRLMTAWVCNS